MPGAARTDAGTDGLLEVNDLVRLSVAGSGQQTDGEAAVGVPTRVENVAAGGGGSGLPRYTVAAPRYEGDVEPPEPGTASTLEWPGAQGLWILPVSFVGQEITEDGLRLWTVDVIAAARQHERRSFVRVDWAVPVSLVPRTAAEIRNAMTGESNGAVLAAPSPGDGSGGPVPDSIVGETRNVGEGGIRCLLPEPELPAGLGVSVDLELAGEAFRIPAQVAWVRPTGSLARLLFDVALAFDSSAVHGDRLRPLLFAEQLRVRRSGLA